MLTEANLTVITVGRKSLAEGLFNILKVILISRTIARPKTAQLYFLNINSQTNFAGETKQKGSLSETERAIADIIPLPIVHTTESNSQEADLLRRRLL